MSLRTPLGKVLGRGSAKEGVHHWWVQRLTAIALVPLTIWFVVSLLTELAVVLILRTQGAAWKSRPGRLLLWTTIAVALAAPLIPYLGGLAKAFGFTPLPPALMGAMLLIVVLYGAATEAAKRLFFGTVQRRAAR